MPEEAHSPPGIPPTWVYCLTVASAASDERDLKLESDTGRTEGGWITSGDLDGFICVWLALELLDGLRGGGSSWKEPWGQHPVAFEDRGAFNSKYLMLSMV